MWSYIADLFKRAFIDGLHQPNSRPTADEWERALVKTVDLLQPCSNPSCEQKWYPFDNSRRPVCPFCGTPHSGSLPVLNLYSAAPNDSYRLDNHRIMVYSGQSLFKWHANSTVFPNERLSADEAKRVGYFVLHNGNWWLVNEGLPEMYDVQNKIAIPIGGKIKLTEGAQVLLQKGQGGRLISVQMAGQ
nr:hypothetical protein [Alysiella crassa]UOP06485.1 hypothetical protein LVJ80_12085 [Alysiella crassa]